MKNTSFKIAKAIHEIALPCRIVWERKWKGMWAFVFQCLIWGLVVSHTSPKPKPRVERFENIEMQAMKPLPPDIKPTKAYADDRQKAKKHRRRKRSHSKASA